MTTSPAASTSSRPARRKCYRCDSPSTLLLRKTVASCTSCALKAVDARTRPLLELARGAALLDTNGFLDGMSDRVAGSSNGAGSSDRPPGAVALAFSGGPSSRALLDIAVRSLSPPPIPIDADPSSSSQQNGKRRPVDVTRLHVIYIDDSALYGGSSQDQTDEVRAIVESYGGAVAGLNFVPVKLEAIFEEGDRDEAVEQLVLATQEEAAAGRPSSRIRAQKRPHTKSSSARASLLSLFSALSPTTTAARSTLPAVRTRFETLHHSLLQHLLRRTARYRLGCSSLLLGESATRSSVRMLSSLAVGAGHKWAVEGAEGGVWVDDLLVLRPMKETLDKEVAFYVKYKELRCVEIRNLVGPPAAGPASIGRLTQSFIAALEKGVPSTVSTVGRTGSKLVLKEAGSMSSLGESLLPVRGSFDDVVRGKSGVGQKGDRLMATVLKDTQRWTWKRRTSGATSSSSAATNGESATPRFVVLPCPLCGLPAQEGAGRWRQKITIRQQDAGEEVDANGEAACSSSSSSVNLDEMLCYPCLSLFLDAAQAQATSASGDGLLLPTHVLRFVEERTRYAREASTPAAPESNGYHVAAATEDAAIAADDDLDASADGGRRRAAAAAAPAPATAASANGKEELGTSEATAAGDAESVAILRRHATRRLDKQDMQGKIGGYLLDEEEEGSAPQ